MTYIEALTLYKGKLINKVEYVHILREILKEAKRNNFGKYKIYVRGEC